MPKVSEEYRAARREEIALAALRAVVRRGFANVTVADVIEESGLSAGAIYSNFRDKAELARFMARVLIGDRVRGAADSAGHGDEPPSPTELLTRVLESLERDHVPFGVLLQLWAAATVDPQLHDIVMETAGGLRLAMHEGVLRWVAARHPDAADPELLAERTALAMMGLAQGYIARAALLDLHDPRAYLADVAEALGA